MAEVLAFLRAVRLLRLSWAFAARDAASAVRRASARERTSRERALRQSLTFRMKSVDVASVLMAES